jgi:hypothetical protein
MANRPVTIALRSIRCIEETNEVGADEPYVLVTACALTGPIPQVEVTRYGPFSDVDKGETHATIPFPPGATDAQILLLSGLPTSRRPFWFLDNKSAKAITDPAKVILIVSMMEHDDGDPAVARTLVKGAATLSLGNSLSLPRPDRVQKLLADIRDALKTPTGFPNFDDRVQSKELKLSASDVALTAKGEKKSLSLDLKGDGGHYRAVFDIVAH